MSKNPLKTEKAHATALATITKMPPITSQEGFERTAHAAGLLQSMSKKIKDHYKPLKSKAKDTHTAIVAAEKEQLAPVMEMIGKAKQVMLGWNEKLRLEREAAAKQEQDRIDALNREEANRQAQELDRAGKTTEADAVITESFENRSVVTMPKGPKTAGVAQTYTYDFAVFNENLVPRQYLVVDSKGVRAAIKASEGTITIPGIRVIKTPGLKIQGAR